MFERIIFTPKNRYAEIQLQNPIMWNPVVVNRIQLSVVSCYTADIIKF